MATGSKWSSLFVFLLVVHVPTIAGESSILPATTGDGASLRASDFTLSGEQGFGDRHNSWPWAMQWWNDRLYVGTYRAYSCVQQWELQRVTSPVIFPYPPTDPDIECTANPADLAMVAEIWRWTPEADVWERVYRSPVDIANPDQPGKMLPRAVGFRTVALHTDTQGVEAMYFGAVTTRPMWDGDIPPPEILRSTDGERFTPVPQDPGTFLGDLPKASFRSFTPFRGKLFALHGSVQGAGAIVTSVDPKLGNNAWTLVAPQELLAFELQVFNDALYIGTFEPGVGYRVLKTQAIGEPPYEFLEVVPHGAYLTPQPSDFVLGMHVFNDHLFVGTGSFAVPSKPTELIRINTDDTWELVVGTPRNSPQGWKFPLSGIEEGFSNGFTDHMWRMQDYNGYLYVGTYDSSTEWRFTAGAAAQISVLNGLDLYRTRHGWYFNPTTTDGFGDPFSYGVRNFAATPYGLFVGAANPYYGLKMFRGVPSETTPVPAPSRLEVEMLGRRPLLHWKPAPSALRYKIQRSRVEIIDEFPNLLGYPHAPAAFVEVGDTTIPIFRDAALATGDRFLYKVIATDAHGSVSEASNLVQVPPVTPPVSFEILLAVTDKLASRGRFVTSDAEQTVRQQVLLAQVLAVAGSTQASIDLLESLLQLTQMGAAVLRPDDVDFEILLDKLIRRLALSIPAN